MVKNTLTRKQRINPRTERFNPTLKHAIFNFIWNSNNAGFMTSSNLCNLQIINENTRQQQVKGRSRKQTHSLKPFPHMTIMFPLFFFHLLQNWKTMLSGQLTVPSLNGYISCSGVKIELRWWHLKLNFKGFPTVYGLHANSLPTNPRKSEKLADFQDW